MTYAVFSNSRIQHHRNPALFAPGDYPQSLEDILGQAHCQKARDSIRRWAGYQPTPLHCLTGLAKGLDIGAIYYKDESRRFDLGSFKALGGAYAVLCLLKEEITRMTGKSPDTKDILDGKYIDITKGISVVTATDGNHGRSVAWGADQFGCKCYIYLHAKVSKGRADAVKAYGAHVVWINGNYDDSVCKVAEDAEANGWLIVSDTSYEGYIKTPKEVMAGYTIMTAEIAEKMAKAEPPTHLFIQGGVGGLAGAVCAHLWQIYGAYCPRIIVVEPDRADCLYQSSRKGQPVDVYITKETIMAGLSCGKVSTLGWEILSRGAADFLTIEDKLTVPGMKLLAKGQSGDPAIVAGESAIAGLVALIAARQDETLSDKLGLNRNSRVLLIGTEGATDPKIYAKLVGKKPEEIA